MYSCHRSKIFSIVINGKIKGNHALKIYRVTKVENNNCVSKFSSIIQKPLLLSIAMAVCMCSSMILIYEISLEVYMLLLNYNTQGICMYNTCILVLSHYTAKGKQMCGGNAHFTSTHGCIQSTPNMANTYCMKALPFASVSGNEMLDNIITQNNYCGINSFPSSNNDILTDLDPYINNLIPNGLKNHCKGYDTSSEFNKNICFQNKLTMLHANICISSKKKKRFHILYYKQFEHHFLLHRIE